MSDKKFKEINGVEDFEKILKEMHESWEEICENFSVDPKNKLQPDVIKNNIRTTLVDLVDIEEMDYVKKSGKKLECLHETYLKCLVKFAFSTVEGEESQVWREEVESFIGKVITPEVIADSDIRLADDLDMSMDKLLENIQRVFSISNQLNVIRGMERGTVSKEMFMNLEDNFIYLGIGIVQTCNENALIMGKVVTFIKTLIKINENILKAISQMLSK